jgi:uncharacterized protein involved in type VI secretion and phage assembly
MPSATPTNRVFGVVIGVVTNNQDPENLHRVKLRFQGISEEDVESTWAYVTTPMAGAGRGAYFLPEVDDEVLVAFRHGLVDQPYVIGSLWNGQDAPPESNDNGENNHRTIVSRSGHVLRFNDQSGSETIEIIDKTGNNKIVIDTAGNSISIEADTEITIKASSGKLSIQANGIEVKSQASLSVEAAQNIDIKAGAQLTLKGAMIKLN